MYDPITDLMRVLADGAEADEAFAEHFAALARHCDAQGDKALADAMTRHGSLHRVKAITLRARLGVLADEYGPLHAE